MSRLQLALNVADLEEAITFYTTLFRTDPAKTRPGYANFEIADPPLKLVLFANPEETGTLNHLGIEHGSVEAVDAERRRLQTAGQELLQEENVDCCHAVQTKFWVRGPDGQRWENYVVIADAHPELEGKTALETEQLDSLSEEGAACCGNGQDSHTDAGQPGAATAAAGRGCC